MADLWSNLLDCLELSPSGDLGTGESTTAGFEGRNLDLEYHRLFGGQLLAQFVEAARSVCPDKSVKSMHSVFSKEGRADGPVHYEVARQHEGRSFAGLLITARQPHGVIASAAVSMHVPEGGPELQDIAGPGALLPEDDRTDFSLIPWEIRTTGDLNSTAASPPQFEFWMRTPQVDAELAPALTAYATDLNVIGTALLPLEGYSQTGNGTAFNSAVTTHTVWYHQPFRTDDWLLVRQHSPLLTGSRSFGRGDVLTEDNRLVASFAQEALVRIRP